MMQTEEQPALESEELQIDVGEKNEPEATEELEANEPEPTFIENEDEPTPAEETVELDAGDLEEEYQNEEDDTENQVVEEADDKIGEQRGGDETLGNEDFDTAMAELEKDDPIEAETVVEETQLKELNSPQPETKKVMKPPPTPIPASNSPKRPVEPSGIFIIF